jgi:hypothetical protein
MIIVVHCLSAGLLVAFSWTNLAWIRFRIPADESEKGINSPLARVNSGLGISREGRFFDYP